MSASNFIALFKRSNIDAQANRSKLYGNWSIKNRTWANKSRKELEEGGLSKRVSFAITEAKAAELGEEALAKFKQLLKDITPPNNSKSFKGPFLDQSNGTPVIIFPGVAFSTGIERTMDKFFGEGSAAKAKDLGWVKGHIFGIQTGAIVGAKESLQKSSAFKQVDANIAKEALKFLDIIVDHLAAMDIESASIKDFSGPILTRYEKSSSKFLVEWQSKADNDASAKLVQKLAGRTTGATTGIRGILSPGGSQTAALKSVIEVLRAQGLDSGKITEFESSPSMVAMIGDDIAAAISGKPKKLKASYSAKNIVVGVDPAIYINQQALAKYKSDLAKAKVIAGRYKAKILASKTEQQVTTPLVNLESILRASINQQVARNMGNGSESRILNYRTGRLAESVSIDRVSESRQGMISVFYNYMKNPYATFSEGGRQQSPKTRDPKALISKSIRELAAPIVGNRLRSVLV